DPADAPGALEAAGVGPVPLAEVPAALRAGLPADPHAEPFVRASFSGAAAFSQRARFTGARLVHGLNADDHRLHAWIELPGGLSYDGGRAAFYPTDAYRHAYRLRPLASYTPAEVARLAAETGTGGPWAPSVLRQGVVSIGDDLLMFGLRIP